MRLTLFHKDEVVIIEGETEEVLRKADEKVVEWQSA
jgi:hypothetical protein